MSRVALSNTGDWKLKHREQDVRGWPVHDARGTRTGEVDHLIVDTDQRRVSTLVLDDGREVPARDVRLGDGVVYLETPADQAVASSVTVYDDRGHVVEREEVAGAAFDSHRDAFREHHRSTFGSTGHGYETYEPAYRYGYEQAHTETHRNRPYRDVESDLQRGYGEHHGAGDWTRDRDAVRHGYNRAQRGR